MVTQERLKELFTYSEETGEFTNRINRGRARKGNKAGGKMSHGYVRIVVDYEHLLLHRAAWLYTYGNLPKYIDHIDHNPSNNKLNNLREVTHQENMKNSGVRKNNTSGITGVSWCKITEGWRAIAYKNGKQKYLGSFKDKELAELVVTEARNKYGYHTNHGTSL